MDFDALERLGRLRESGAMTAQEFEAEKRRILGTEPEPPYFPQADYVADEVPDRSGPRIILIICALLAIAGAGYFAYSSIAPGTPEDALGGEETSLEERSLADQPSPYRVSSSVGAIRVVSASTLPNNPAAIPVDDYCTGFPIEPETAAGRIIQQGGWHVTGEAKIGDLDVVSFAGSFEPGTSGACFAKDPNIGFFSEESLQAIAYGKSIGTVKSVAANRGRIWSNDMRYATAVADIEQTDNAVQVTTLSKSDAVCSDSAMVPNVFNSPIQRARATLGIAGWAPVSQIDEADLRTKDLREAGIIETEACSGTGYASCSFIYRDRAGRSLTVTSAGEEPVVLDYGVACTRE